MRGGQLYWAFPLSITLSIAFIEQYMNQSTTSINGRWFATGASGRPKFLMS